MTIVHAACDSSLAPQRVWSCLESHPERSQERLRGHCRFPCIGALMRRVLECFYYHKNRSSSIWQSK